MIMKYKGLMTHKNMEDYKVLKPDQAPSPALLSAL